MTVHERHNSVREILTKSNYIPYRNSPTPGQSPSHSDANERIEQRLHIELQETRPGDTPITPGGLKRGTPTHDYFPDSHTDQGAHASKRVRIDPGPPQSPSIQNDILRGREGSFSRSSVLVGRSRTQSPSVSFEAAETMLNRADELGGNRTTRLARGLPGSPVSGRPSRVKSRQTSDQSVPTVRSSHRNNSLGTQTLEQIGIVELLQSDDRPVFVVDLEQNTDAAPIIFTNNALKQRPSLFESIHGRVEDAALLLDAGVPYSDFKTWLFSENDTLGLSSSFPFSNHVWKISTLRNKIRIVTGTPTHSSPTTDSSGRPSNLQKFHHLGSSSSNNTVRRATPDRYGQPGYFDVRPGSTRKRIESPLNMQGLLTASMSEEDEESPLEVLSNGKVTSHGDSGMADLLASPPSLNGDPTASFMPMKSNPETLQLMSMDYLNDKGFFDWTRIPFSDSLPEHIQFARNFDWSKTGLGPIEEWPADLRGMCNLIMASPHPAAMYWGPDHVAIYNEPYIMLAGNKHPNLMGARYQDAWREIWDAIAEVFALAMSNAQSTMKDDDCLFIMRNGFLEETYFSWSIIPLIGDDGSVVGLYNPCFEKTRRKVAERRMLTLREIGERTSAARAISQFWTLLLDGFQYNEYDAPLVIVYSLNDAEDSDAASSTSSTAAALKQCRLEGALGVPPGHPCAPDTIDLKHDSGRGFGSIFKRSIVSDRPIVLSLDDGVLDPSLLQGIQWRGFGDPSTVFVVAPIRPTTGESTLGFLVMGTNPRRPYDEDYDLFVQLLSRQLATSIASVVLFEEEIHKGQRAAQIAAQDRIDLTNQLAVRTQEAVESENKFTRMAELAPVGMYIGDSTGSFTFANDAWFALSSYPRHLQVGNDWIKMVLEEDREEAWKAWAGMLATKRAMTIEFRFKTMWKDRFGNQSHTWVLASASPEKDEDGNITRVFGSVTDISSQKFAESLQRKRMEEAVQLKQQQERYIDTTSHEMRNPLSAILQSADAITGSLAELKIEDGMTATQIESIDGIIESAQTITLCAQHQKRIVDDVLTLSKLDSAMLLVTPVDTQPESIARRTVKMFEGESQTVDISVTVQIDKSYRDLNIDYIRLDPTRLSQVLINLMTNAIKFTTTQERREIRMQIAASREKPSKETKYNLTYIPSQTPKDKDVTAAPEWGLGEPIYIHFAVSDTGRGLDEEEKKQLFQRFSQANPRTHVTYGGSGLGLFISRELVELQGGEIGVASESGKGSTFAFYVKGRRSERSIRGEEDDHLDVHGKVSRKPSAARHKSKLSQIKTEVADAENKPVLRSPNTTATKMSQSKTDAAGLRILIVEDNLINQKVLAAQLRKLGCVVSVANHGGEAIDLIKKSSFYNHLDLSNVKIEIDVVLMDLEMPVMDGMTCARTLRKMQEDGELIRHIPVIAVTANAREEQIKNTLDAGIDDVVSKPFRIPELVPKMRDTIAKFTNGKTSDASSVSIKMDVDRLKSEESLDVMSSSK